MYVVLSCQLVRVVGGVRTFFRIFVLSTCPYPERQKHRSYAIIYFKSYQYTRISRIVGIVIKFLQFELIGRLSLIFPIILIVFYIIGSVFRADFFIFSHVWSHHSRKVVFHAWNIRLQELLGPTLVLQG